MTRKVKPCVQKGEKSIKKTKRYKKCNMWVTNKLSELLFKKKVRTSILPLKQTWINFLLGKRP